MKSWKEAFEAFTLSIVCGMGFTIGVCFLIGFAKILLNVAEFLL